MTFIHYQSPFFVFPFQNNIKKENIIILTWKSKKEKMELNKAPFI